MTETIKAVYQQLFAYFTKERKMHPVRAHRFAKHMILGYIRPRLHDFAIVPLMTLILPPNIPTEIGYSILEHLDDATVFLIANME